MDITAGLAKLKSQINKLERRIHTLDMNEVDPKELHAAIESLNALKARYKEMKEDHEKKKQEKESKVIPMDKDTVVKEHEHLVDVLKSPSHADDAAEAKKQEKELTEYKEAAPEVTDKVRCNMCQTVYPEDVEQCAKCKTHEYMMQPFIPMAEYKMVAANEPAAEEPKKPETADGGAIIMKFPRRPHRKQPKPFKVVDTPTPSAIPGEAPQEKQSDVSKFAIHDVVEPARGTPGSKGRVMGHDEANDMVYVSWSEGSLKDSHGYGAYSAKDLKKHASVNKKARGPFFQDFPEEVQQRVMDAVASHLNTTDFEEIDDFINRNNHWDALEEFMQGMDIEMVEEHMQHNASLGKKAEWAIEYYPNDSDKMKVHKGFQSKEEADKWVKAENIHDRGTDVSVYQVKEASKKQAGPGAGREFEVEKGDITDGSFIYNVETGKITWKQMPQITAFSLLGYYDGIRDADGRLVKITDVEAGWWEHGQANVKSDLSAVIKAWQQEMPHQWDGITGDVEVGVGFRDLKAMLGGGWARTTYKPGDTFQACGDGYLTANYDMYEIGLCATIQAQEEFDYFEQDVFENTSPPDEPDEDGNIIDPETWYDMQTDNYKVFRPKQKSSKRDQLKKEAADSQLSQKLIGDLKRVGWDVKDVSTYSVDLERGGMTLEIYEDGASGYEDSKAAFENYMTKNKALTDKIQQDFEEGYSTSTHRQWAGWRGEWVEQNLGVKPDFSGNTYNNDPAYFWGSTFEFTSYPGGAVVMFHHGGDARGNYGLPEVWDGDFDEVYAMLSHDDNEEEVSNYIGEDLLSRIRSEVWGKDMAEIPSVSSKKNTLMKQAAANEAVIDSFVNRINPNIKSNNLYIRDRGDGWELINYQTVIAKHLGDKIAMDNKQYSVTTSKLQGLIGYKASQAGIPIVDMSTGQPADNTKKREKAPQPPFNKLPSGQPYERVSTQADDHDTITDEPSDEDTMEMDHEPTDEDIFIQDDRGKTHAWYSGKPIASLENDDWDAFHMAIAQWMSEQGYFPNVWTISDHGNAHLVTDIPQAAKTAAAPSRQQAWDVFLNGKHIDTVFANGYNADEMKRSLINHDGYDPNIIVRLQRNMRSSLKKKATGEPDQDYDKAAYDQMVAQLEAAGFPGATHREFDKYQGVFLRVPGVDKFWGVDSFFTGQRTDETRDSHDFQYKPGTETFHLIMSPENNPDVQVEVIQKGDAVDASDLVEYVKTQKGQHSASKKVADHMYGMKSIHAEEGPNGDLIIAISDQNELQEIKDAIAGGDTSDDAMYDVFEHLIANGYSWVAPEQIGALTDAPILTDSPSLDDGSIDPQGKIWWYPQYETRSPLEDIAETGKTTFTLAKPDTTAAFKGQKLVKKAIDYKNPKVFFDYVWQFYGPGQMHGEFFDNKLTPKELQDAIKIRMADPNFEGDTVDREAVRDILFKLPHYQKNASKKEAAGNKVPLTVFDGGFYAVETSGQNPEAPHGYAIFDAKNQQVMVITTENQLSPERLSSIVQDEYGKRELVRATLKADFKTFKAGTKFIVSGINNAKKQVRVKADKTHVWLPIEKVAVTVDLEQHIQQMKDRMDNTQQTLQQSVTTKAEVEVVADDVNVPPTQVLPEGQKWMWNAQNKRWMITTVPR